MGSHRVKLGHLPTPQLSITSRVGNTISLSWSLPRPYSYVSQYVVERGNDGLTFPTTVYTGSGLTTSNVVVPVSGVPVVYRVRYLDTRGKYSAYSQSKSSIVYAPAFSGTAPTSRTFSSAGEDFAWAPYVTDVDPGDTKSWSLPSRYRTDITINSSTGVMTVPSTASGTSGNVTVRVTDAYGLYAEHTMAVTVTASVGTPIISATRFSETRIDLSCTTATNAVAYTFEWSTTGASPQAAPGTSGWSPLQDTSSTAYSHTPLTPNTTYYYRVSARALSGLRSTWTTASANTNVVSGTLVLFDNFNYAVSESNIYSEYSNPFVANGPWTGAMARNCLVGSTRDPGGWISTVDINQFQANTGYTALSYFPAGGSHAVRYKCQNIGGGKVTALRFGQYPSDVWTQFWYFMPFRVGYERSYVQNRFKWIYPNYGSTWPRYLFEMASGNSYNPMWEAATPGAVDSSGQWSSQGVCCLIDRDNSRGDDVTGTNGGAVYSRPGGMDPDNHWKLGPNVQPTQALGFLQPNRWYLIKMHHKFDVAGNAGVWEVWMREHDQPFRKTHHWVSGSSTPTLPGYPESGGTFEWPVDYTAPFAYGELGSTVGWGDSGTYMYIYMDDFAMATSESALPTY